MCLFYLIRHGERDTPDAMLPGRAPGVNLTVRGLGQAEWIARRLAPERIDVICSSPLERARQTAAPLARDKRLAVEVSAALTEIDFGEWTGRPVAELESDMLWQRFNRFRSGTRIPGGETAIDVQHRVIGELLRRRDEFEDGVVACFSHADPIRLALMYLLGAPADYFDRVEIGVGSITTVELTKWSSRIVKLNEGPGP